LLSLDVTGNNLQELPGNISMFVALKKLVLSNN
jgi:Leucine-rich repeat (LRR) protein